MSSQTIKNYVNKAKLSTMTQIPITDEINDSVMQVFKIVLVQRV